MTFSYLNKKEKKVFAALFFMFMVCNILGVTASEDKDGLLFYILFATTLATSFLFILVTLDFFDDILSKDAQVDKGTFEAHNSASSASRRQDD